MSLKVFWTEEAEETFIQNITYLEENWNRAVIENFVQKTEAAILLISKHPSLYPVISKKRRIHKCIIVKQVSLYYKLLDTQIELLAFWNNYQNPKKLKY